VRLPAGPAVFVRYVEAPAGKRVVTRQYYLVHGGRLYIVTYTALPAAEKADLATFARSIDSLRLGTGTA